LTEQTTQQITVSLANTPPVASFIINPASGDTETTFQFDASVCSDNEDPASSLQVRWDWESDGTWDTDYSTDKTATHQYSTEGTKIVKLEVTDTEGLKDIATDQITVTEASDYESGTVKFYGETYKTVKIGNQWWLAENLKVTQYRDGSAILNITVNGEWRKLSSGAYCAYNNDEGNADIYGYLYNWYAVNDSRNIAPLGWHVPTYEEWQMLVAYLGGNAGSKLAGRADLWKDGNLEDNSAFDESGFSALPAGSRHDGDGVFYYLGSRTYFWSSTESSNNAWRRYLNCDSSGMHGDNANKRRGFSVRLVKD